MDELNELDFLHDDEPRRAEPRIFRPRPDYFELYRDFEFRDRFRFTKPGARFIIDLIRDDILPATKRNHAISAEVRTLAALRFYATGCMGSITGDLFGFSESSACRIVNQVSEALASKKDLFIQFPSGDEVAQAKKEFKEIASFPGVVGCVDGCHFNIASPGGDDGALYFDRNRNYSINAQVVCSAKLLITNVVARWYGSAHDSRIFENSRLNQDFINGVKEGILLGDAGYACKQFLLTPVANPTTAKERQYNSRHKRTRQVIERTFGLLKQRFQAVKFEIRLKLQHVLPAIVAMCVLHNIAIKLNERVFEPEDDQEEDEDEISDIDDQLDGLAFRRMFIENNF